MDALAPAVEANQLIRTAKKSGLRAYWLEATLLAGVIAGGFAIHRALTLPRDAVVLVSEVHRGTAVKPEHVAYAPLVVSARNVTRRHNLEGLVAVRDLEPGAPLRWTDVVKPRPRARPRELELALKLFVGRTPPQVGEVVLLGVVSSDRGDAFVVVARVLAADTTLDPASLTVAMSERDAVRMSTIPKPQIQLMHRSPQEPKR